MTAIIFRGWIKGMRGISFILLLREKTNLSLKNAKNIKERIVDGEVITLPIADLSTAQEIIADATNLGVICELE